MSFKALKVEHILQLHVLAIQKYGGTEGIRDLGRLESAVASQAQEVFGEALYATVYQKSAALIRNIIGDHPFFDGNKRTAMLSGITLLELNDVVFIAKKGELEDFAVKVAVDHLEVDEIAVWLQMHSKKK